VADVAIALGGFGSQGWGEAAWGYGNSSVSASGELGSVVVSLGIDVSVTGVEATGAVGSVVV
jgi:hypothetical protein